MEVYVVDHRRNGDGETMDTAIMFVGSTLEKAIAFCKENTDVDKHDVNNPWWWYITVYRVDNDNILTNFDTVAILDWNGNEIEDQPIDGYKI